MEPITKITLVSKNLRLDISECRIKPILLFLKILARKRSFSVERQKEGIFRWEERRKEQRGVNVGHTGTGCSL